MTLSFSFSRRTLLHVACSGYALLTGIVKGDSASAQTPALAATGRMLVLLALGDSLTAGYGLPEPQSFPAQLEAALRQKGYNIRVINAGVSGDTSADGLARLDWVLEEPADAVIVELGANDALRGLPPALAENNLSRILTTLQARHLPVLLAGMKAPRNLGEEYVRAFDAIYPRLQHRFGTRLYPFFLDGIIGGPAGLLQPDGLHPTAAGVARIVSSILPETEALLRSLPPVRR